MGNPRLSCGQAVPAEPGLLSPETEPGRDRPKKDDIGFFKTIDPNKRIYIRTYDAFYPNNDLLSFIPVPHLMERIKTVTSTFNDSTIGIHIRRTDNTWSTEHSPTEKFIHYIEQEIRSNPLVNFFLATDSPQEEETMHAHFGDRINFCKKSYSRATLAGMKDALVDMYSLAATRRIYASWYSSFSWIASQINNREMITVYE